MSARRTRVETVVAQRTRSLVVVLEDIEDPHNIAAVLRTCEAFGVQEIHAISRRFAFQPHPKISMGADKWLDIHLYRDTRRCLSLLEERGYLLCATDLGEGAVSLVDLPQDRPLALIFGTEKVGVTPEALAACHLRFKIPMLGFTQSLNISVAAAVCISHLTFERMRRLEGFGDLPAADRAQLEERFFTLSVKQRHRLFPAQARPAPQDRNLNSPGAAPSEPPSTLSKEPR